MAEKTVAEQMKEWGAMGGKARAKRYTSRELSLMAKRGLKKRTLKKLKARGNGA